MEDAAVGKFSELKLAAGKKRILVGFVRNYVSLLLEGGQTADATVRVVQLLRVSFKQLMIFHTTSRAVSAMKLSYAGLKSWRTFKFWNFFQNFQVLESYLFSPLTLNERL